MKLTNKWRCEKLGVTIEAVEFYYNILDSELGGDWDWCARAKNKEVFVDSDRYKKTENIEESVFEFVQISEPENIDEFISSLKLKQTHLHGLKGECVHECFAGGVECEIRDTSYRLIASVKLRDDLEFETQKATITNFFKVFNLLEE